MSSINLHKDEIGIKIVYYGPGLGGKTTSIQAIHKALRPDNRGNLISLATGVDRTLYFDFLPVKLPKVRGFTIRLSLYTVPGQVHYNATRKLVLQGADGVVFVADSQRPRHEANIESLKNLYDNLRGHGMNPDTVPLVIQYNKRDLPDVLSVEKLEKDLNGPRLPFYETCATSGKGVFDALKAITKLVLADLKRKGIYGKEPDEGEQSGQSLSETMEIKAPSSESSGIQHAISSHLETDVVAEIKPSRAPREDATITMGAPTSGPSMAGLWKKGTMREHVASIERHIIKRDFSGAIERTQSALRDLIDEVGGVDNSLVEALLALGVHGGHYVRFQHATTTGTPNRIDALFCLFFLTDVELRLQEAGARVA